GFSAPNSCCEVVGPRTTTAAAVFSSSAVKKRPLSMARARTAAQAGVVPTTLVVQLLDPTVSVPDDWVLGATCATSGATIFDWRASASPLVSVLAVPKPPRMPPVVTLPGETISRLVPRELI